MIFPLKRNFCDKIFEVSQDFSRGACEGPKFSRLKFSRPDKNPRNPRKFWILLQYNEYIIIQTHHMHRYASYHHLLYIARLLYYLLQLLQCDHIVIAEDTDFIIYSVYSIVLVVNTIDHVMMVCLCVNGHSYQSGCGSISQHSNHSVVTTDGRTVAGTGAKGDNN